MDRLQTLEMFVAVAREGGFAAAARTLRVSPPAVTRGVAALEARLGVALFHRSTRAVALTAEGAVFLEQARRAIADLAGAERALAGLSGVPQGQLYVTAPVQFGRLHVLPVVAELIDRHPRLDVRLLLVDRNVRTVEEGIDVAVRIGPLADSSLVAIRIGAVRQTIVASPAYCARHGVPARPADLESHHLISSSGPRAASEWRFGPRHHIAIAPRLRVTTIDAAVAATQAGVGIANLLSYQVAAQLAAGQLIEILRPDEPELLPVSLLFEAHRGTAPTSRAFIAAMRDYAAGCRWD